jgi:short-subunit dehydrogenase involved in D-alanine esterification of teichoic acids
MCDLRFGRLKFVLINSPQNNSLTLDVSDRDSIIEAKNFIEKNDGKLHILVNK